MKKTKKLTKAALHVRALHRRRTAWLAVLLGGILLIQIAYNFHDGQPKVLGYSANVEQSKLLEETNQYRAKKGLSPLKTNEQLAKAAQAKAQDMTTKNYWEHIAPDGTSPWSFFEREGYHFQAAGENLAYGFLSSSEVVNAWVNSQTHRDNVLGNYSEVGFGIQRSDHYQGGDNIVVVAFYGTPSSNPANTKEIKSLSPATAAQSSSKQVNGMAVIATGGANWAMYASFGLLGAAAIGFVVTHLELLRLGWYRSRRYLALHPVADAAAIVVIALLLVYAAGGVIR